jgi:hypothetical protein
MGSTTAAASCVSAISSMSRWRLCYLRPRRQSPKLRFIIEMAGSTCGDLRYALGLKRIFIYSFRARAVKPASVR